MYLAELLKYSMVKSEDPEDSELVIIAAGVRPGADYNLVISRDKFEYLLVKYRASEPASEAVLMSIRKSKSPDNIFWDTLLTTELISSHYTKLCDELRASKLRSLEVAEEDTEDREVSETSEKLDSPSGDEEQGSSYIEESGETASDPGDKDSKSSESSGAKSDEFELEEEYVSEEDDEFVPSDNEEISSEDSMMEPDIDSKDSDETSCEEDAGSSNEDATDSDEPPMEGEEHTVGESKEEPEEASVSESAPHGSTFILGLPSEDVGSNLLSQISEVARGQQLESQSASIPASNDDSSTSEVSSADDAGDSEVVGESETKTEEKVSTQDAEDSASQNLTSDEGELKIDEFLLDEIYETINTQCSNLLNVFNVYGVDAVCKVVGISFDEFVYDLRNQSPSVDALVIRSGGTVDFVHDTSIMYTLLNLVAHDAYTLLKQSNLEAVNELMAPILNILYEE